LLPDESESVITIIKKYKFLLLLFVLLAGMVIFLMLKNGSSRKIMAAEKKGFDWRLPDTVSIPHSPAGELIRYGLELVRNTSYYIGPKGTVATLTNGMNCQNCHLDAGTKFWGNNYGAVFSTYPKFRERSGRMETINRRITDCLERSLNSISADSNSHEVKAIFAYLQWLGSNVPKKIKPEGSGIEDIEFLDRAADSVKGSIVFAANCQSCHAADGNGVLNAPGSSYIYPPLWGMNSYTTTAGLYRISRFAGFVKNNMPFGATSDARQLTNEEAWDVAAFVNSKPRPNKVFVTDWPNISSKPMDYPFGPYTDGFSAEQHKYGPFLRIKKQKQLMEVSLKVEGK
jgi:thiosulfate dehydrogenase